MSITRLLAILQARWRAALAAFACVIALAALAVLLQPKRYTATASVLLDVKSPDPIAGMVLQGMMSPSYMLTQVDVISSQRVAIAAARALKLLDSPALRADWMKSAKGQGSFDAWVAEGLRQSLDVRPSRGSNVIYVAYTHSDPAYAASVANAIVQSYVEITLELRVEPARAYSKYFDLHAKQLRAELEAAQKQLSDYRRRNGLVESSDRVDIEVAQLAELSSQLIALQAAATESGTRSGQAGSNADRMPEALANPVVSQLTAERSRTQVRLDELQTRLGDQHPQVVELKTQIAQLSERIRLESQRVAGSLGVNSNVNSIRLAQARRAVDEQRAKVVRMKTLQDESAVLQQDVANAQRAYDGVLARLNQASLEGQTAQANVSALELAATPTLPSSPQVRTVLILAVLFGGGLGVGVALYREMRDRRVRTDEDMARLVNSPVLISIPHFAVKTRQRQALPNDRMALGQRLVATRTTTSVA